MSLLSYKSNFVLTKFENHLELKQYLLDLIKNLGTHSIVENFDVRQQISNTDWYLGHNVKRDYIGVILPYINQHCRQVANELKLPFDLIPGRIWFQQYMFGDHHDWHVHANCLYSSIYYLDLPEGTSKTTFKILDNEFEIDVEEGDILTFPGNILHSSKPNKSKNIKTVISFNASLKDI